MAKPLAVEEAVERARRAEEHRIDAIRALALARQNLADVRTETAQRLADVQREIAQQVADAEREDARQYQAALTAGWTADELRKIGYTEPDKQARTRRRASRQPPPASTAAPSSDTSTPAATPAADQTPEPIGAGYE